LPLNITRKKQQKQNHFLVGRVRSLVFTQKGNESDTDTVGWFALVLLRLCTFFVLRKCHV